ncbi:hypothetical protein JOE40_002710 [Arthrobacter sp. PvP102]|uniref:hypothetical protein n=1 Tax=unclassified Arthrobacter TaxID=235627 RepID=UPI001AE7D62D|nr:MULTISPECIES: hypothetical protein [unclassified Arthrobacter]MBP1233066.1 hypothetical protein [Arthrobacter sp. PvP103]MBP1238201.1 hypothetical protein [Arthrobacter sp. PvP102]
MKKFPVLGVAAAAILALAGCTGGGGQSPSPTATATTSAAQAKVYSEDELRGLISGRTDKDGNELKLFSKDQVEQGSNIANLLMSAATTDPAGCKGIATAGLLDKVESGDVAIAISGGSQPRTLSAQSGSEGPDAAGLLNDVSGNMDQCAKFTLSVLGQRYEVASKELNADTNGEETFATVSTRDGNVSDMLMQVSAAQGRLLVVATKGGANLGDADQKELEDMVNDVLDKAEGGSSGTATPTPTGTSTSTVTGTSTPSVTETTTATVTATPTASESAMSPSPSK